MLLAGELDAAVHYISTPNLVDRSRVAFDDSPVVRRLFPDPVSEGVRYHRSTGLYPINHCVAIKREIAARHPWAILNLYKAFERANAIANEQRMEHIDYYIETGRLAPEAKNALTAQLDIVARHPWIDKSEGLLTRSH